MNWDQTRRSADGRVEVELTCPVCKGTRFYDKRCVKNRLKKGTFTGRCSKHRTLAGVPRKRRYSRQDHPAVDWDAAKPLCMPDGSQRTHVPITCPKCNKVRWAQPGSTAAHIRLGRFSGECRACSRYGKKRDWVELSPGRKIEPSKGYVRLTREAIASSDLWIYDAQRGDKTYVMEHRFVMAKVLGRPLTSNELVDHMDGDKLNNDPSNLRLYRRGRNEPGETSGYGTYYDEWQRAEARIRELEQRLAA